MSRKRDWYCYICGKPLEEDFVLWSLVERTDRVFLCCKNEIITAPLGQRFCALHNIKNFQKFSTCNFF